jgi:hypothetical protein
MTNEDIIRLAIEHTINGLKFNEDGLLRFAKLVAEHEREACAKLLEDTADGAKKVDPKGFVWQAIQKSAEFIRARGQA